jgi:2-polyprenyl-3-methyl-5-hydroxy-6-metoxy-1,4-benzoquinol methylase
MSSAAPELTVNKNEWPESQRYELLYWKEKWPYRTWPIEELQKLRHADATWLLSNLGFAKKDEFTFQGFEGTVLEVGCGPLGFFELTRGVAVTAIDSLMKAYASEISYATLGARGAATYLDKNLEEITDTYRFVVCSNVLDHTADWMEFLEELVKRVSPDGELLLVTDTRSKPMVGHTQVFTPDHLKRALSWLGMKRVVQYRVDDQKNNNHCDWRVFARVGF